MQLINKEQEYISFLETALNEQDTDTLLKKSFEFLHQLFDVQRVQIWEKHESIKEYSIFFEFSTDSDLPMIKLRTNDLPEKSKRPFDKTSLWEYQNIKDETLIKFNINSLTGVDIKLRENTTGILVLASSKKNKFLNPEEINFFIKIKSILEHCIAKNEKYNSALEQLTKLQAQNEKLRELDRIRTNFINNISHEIRTPLASITGFSKILISKRQSEQESIETTEQIQQSANRLYNLISDFLQINKIDSENWLVHCEPCDVGELIRNTAEEFSSLHKTHKISYKISDNYPIIHTDPKLFRQVLDNLLSNAIKYSPNGGTVIILLNISPDKKELIITISDEGVGIERDEIPQIFNRFYRSNNPAIKNIMGTGLGLSICKEIITSLNGKINVESIIKKGSKFTVILPIS